LKVRGGEGTADWYAAASTSSKLFHRALPVSFEQEDKVGKTRIEKYLLEKLELRNLTSMRASTLLVPSARKQP